MSIMGSFVKNEFFMTCATDSKLVQLRTRRPDAEGHSRQGRSQQSAAESVQGMLTNSNSFKAINFGIVLELMYERSLIFK